MPYMHAMNGWHATIIQSSRKLRSLPPGNEREYAVARELRSTCVGTCAHKYRDTGEGALAGLGRAGLDHSTPRLCFLHVCHPQNIGPALNPARQGAGSYVAQLALTPTTTPTVTMSDHE